MSNMVEPIIGDYSLYWIVVSIAAIISLVGITINCICNCRHSDNKSEFLGLAGMVTITHPENEEFSRVASYSEAGQTYPQDTVDGAGKRSNTANRSLPDIPKDKTVESETNGELRDAIYDVTGNISSDPSDLYATVQDKNKDKKEKQNKQSVSQQSSQDETASLYARLQTPQTSSEEHPYAQVHNVSKTENNQHSSTSHTVDLEQPSTSGAMPVAPPRSRRSSSHKSPLEQPVIVDIPAATAITGGVQANQDLPYMTPPILIPLPQPPQPQNNSQQQQHFSGDSQDSKGYTSISVREPLANIIAQTKSAQQQRRTTRQNTDPHYATVSDDSDEMYAAIDDRDKVYTSGSDTYAQIQPMVVEVNRSASNEQANVHLQGSSRTEELYQSAPQPPSVDSLRHVAHAHSRQASSSSATSSVTNPGSPKPEKRQANSPLPPPPDNPMDMYAVVEKRSKTDDRKNLEDMYAKVIKKKRDTNYEDSESSNNSVTNSPSSMVFGMDVASTSRGDGVTTTARRKLSLMELSRVSWSSYDSVDIQKRDSETVHHPVNEQPQQQQNNIMNGELYSDLFNADHGYAAVIDKRISDPGNDATYETLRPLSLNTTAPEAGNLTSLRNGVDAIPIYSVPFKPRQTSNASSEDPGYERVRVRKRVTVDCSDDYARDTDSEPNYESMPHEPVEPNYASVVGGRASAHDSDADPNYESVGNGDPNYESVKYVRVAQQSASEPPYERLAAYKGHFSDPGYEKIELSSQTVNNADTDDEQYVQV